MRKKYAKEKGKGPTPLPLSLERAKRASSAMRNRLGTMRNGMTKEIKSKRPTPTKEVGAQAAPLVPTSSEKRLGAQASQELVRMARTPCAR
jgi:predicted transcriptional regulator of viral defense system